ncbi:S9 family peptidase, partial [bacterium]
DQWKDGRRRHLFRAALQDGTLGDPVDLMGAMDADAPTKPWGDASEYDFASDGGVVFTARDVGASEPWSTNFDLFYASASGGEVVNLTAANEAWDTAPTISPDGKSIAWLAMSVPDYEADRFRILRADFSDGAMGEAAEVAPDWDRSPGSLAWSSDGKSLIVHANNLGHRGLFAIDAGSGKVRELFVDGAVAGEVEHDGRVFFTRSSFTTPADLWSVKLNGKDERQLTSVNEAALEGIDLGAAEQFTFTGANGDEVHAWIVYPANFDAARKYPVAMMVHGGPQGSFGSNFHYRWNPQTYTGAGYVALAIDFHGSTGYGQEFCDSIQDNWGGWPLDDLKLGLDEALTRYPWMDGDHVAALGASYGGYMMNWIAGNWSDRFTCLVNHDGLFDTEFMYYSTEELWFPEREFLGPPYESRESYDRWNPSLHVDKWQTPMMVVHGEQDHRVPITQGLATFNALQRRGVPSRLLYYPDENHWVLKPHNSLQWHAEVIGWMDQWTKVEAGAR